MRFSTSAGGAGLCALLRFNFRQRSARLILGKSLWTLSQDQRGNSRWKRDESSSQKDRGICGHMRSERPRYSDRILRRYQRLSSGLDEKDKAEKKAVEELRAEKLKREQQEKGRGACACTAAMAEGVGVDARKRAADERSSTASLVPEVKQTRQWAAWTREEEENFFGALRQVGKNFEKITSRVQSKNKDQVLWTPRPVRQPDQHKAPAWVRHYYYRVIKRMNRILAPTLILDAKNSTYVNSAMLRWWALLEKHSCSASKLRLKPRRFKTFVTALEHQLLKDHKKVKAKKPTPAAATSRRHTAHAETTGVISSGLPSLVSSGLDDLQSSTVGGGRKTAVKRKAASNGPRKSLPKGETKRPPRPRKKAADAGDLSKAAYAKWEKAASVGVSLMAEAAEQLERASSAEVMPPASEASEIHATSTSGGLTNSDVQTGYIPPCTSAAFSQLGLSDLLSTELPSGPPVDTLGVGGVPVSSGLSGVPSTSQVAFISAAMSMPAPVPHGAVPNLYEGEPAGLVIIPELCAQVKAKSLALDATRCNSCSSLRCNGPEEATNGLAGAKLKLQLFPFDDHIRKALEQDGHNPHLELTFKARKSIPSVLQHLVQKWGRSTVASGDLRLFPFNTQWSNVSACQSWSFQDLNVSAADVHAALGSPAVFRLRYAWLSSRVLESSSAVLQQQPIPASHESGPLMLPRACYPTPRDSIPPKRSVLRKASVPRSVCLSNSTVISTESCITSSEIQSLPVSGNACRNEDARQAAVLVNTILGVNVQGAAPRESVQSSSLDRVTESEIGRWPCSHGAPAVTVGLQSEKGLVTPALDTASITNKGSQNGDRSKCKELDNVNQISGCAWLSESNDGFAQQLWNCEDTLRSSVGVSISQMEWVDSLTDLSVSQILGDTSRTMFSAPLDNLQPSCGQTQLNCLDSFDIAIAGQELALPPSINPSAPIFCGEDTCDAFSFQRLDRRSKETVNPLGEEFSGNTLGLDSTFGDFRSMACWREGDSLVAFDLPQQPQHCTGQDLLFDGEASIGLGGLIEALAHGSLDEFQACTVSHDAGERDLDQELRHGVAMSGQTRGANAENRTELPSKDGIGRVSLPSFSELARIDELSNGNGELLGLYDRIPEATLPGINLPSQDMESLKVSKSVNTRLQRKKDRRPPQRPFKLPAQCSTARSLKLQG